jgi:hypothetical protein
MRRVVTTLLAVLLVVLPAFRVHGDEAAQASLTGLPGVRIVVDDPEDDLEADGLTETVLRNHIASQLKAAGVRTLSESEWSATPGRPALKIEVTARSVGKGRVFVVELDVEQDVRLARDATRVARATTWSATPRLGVLSSTSVAAALVAVRDAVDEFIAAWRKVNPRR